MTLACEVTTLLLVDHVPDKSVEHLRKAVRWELISYYTLVIICFTVRGHPLRHRLATSPSKGSVFSGAVHSAL